MLMRRRLEERYGIDNIAVANNATSYSKSLSEYSTCKLKLVGSVTTGVQVLS